MTCAKTNCFKQNPIVNNELSISTCETCPFRASFLDQIVQFVRHLSPPPTERVCAKFELSMHLSQTFKEEKKPSHDDWQGHIKGR